MNTNLTKPLAILGIILGILIGTFLYGQELPNLPTPPAWTQLTPTEAIDASRFVFTRAMDPISTWRFLAHGGREDNLPLSFVKDKPAFMGYSLGIAAGEIILEHKLDRTKYYQEHKWFRITERVGIETAIGLMAKQDIHNWGCHLVHVTY